MLANKKLVAAALLALAAPVFASPTLVTLNFEDSPATTVEAVGTRYKVSKGVEFSANAWIASSEQAVAGGFGNFYGTVGSSEWAVNRGAVTLSSNPDPGEGQSSPAGDPWFIVTLNSGFNSYFSMIYTGETGVTLTALDRNGQALYRNNDPLDIVSASGSATAACQAAEYACVWDELQLDLEQGMTAYQIKVEGVYNKSWFDNFTFASVDDGNTVPEPSGIALSFAALGAMFIGRRRISSKR